MRQQIVQKTKPPVVDSIPRVDVLGKKGTHTGARVEFDGWPTWKTATTMPLGERLVSMRHVRHVFMARVSHVELTRRSAGARGLYRDKKPTFDAPTCLLSHVPRGTWRGALSTD